MRILWKSFKFDESFIITGKIDEVSSVDTRLIKNHILSNFSLTSRYDDKQYWYMKDYVEGTLSSTYTMDTRLVERSL